MPAVARSKAAALWSARMTTPIRRVAVLGAGVMGSGIAAHFANAGIPVLLLDIVPPKPHRRREEDRRPRATAFAAGGLEKAAQGASRPRSSTRATRASSRSATSRTTSTRSPDCDLVIEAIIEQLDIKQALFEKLEKLVGPTRIVASNTSGLRIADMLEGRTRAFKKNFLVTALLQPAALHEAPRARRRARDRPEACSRASSASARTCSARASSSARTRRTSSATASALHAMMTTIHLMLEDGPRARGRRRDHRHRRWRTRRARAFRTADVVGLDTFGHVADELLRRR